MVPVGITECFTVTAAILCQKCLCWINLFPHRQNLPTTKCQGSDSLLFTWMPFFQFNGCTVITIWILSICLTQLWAPTRVVAFLKNDTDWPREGVNITACCFGFLFCPEQDFIRGGGNVFTVALLLIECTSSFPYARLCPVPLKVDAETPSVPVQPGTSSLPTWPPRPLCHWRRTAAAATVASPPLAAPPETPPAASWGPAAPAGSPRTAHNMEGRLSNRLESLPYHDPRDELVFSVYLCPEFLLKTLWDEPAL